MQIEIEIRNVYGENKAYPMNREAQGFAKIAGTKTLTRYALRHILEMGLTIVEVDRHGRPSRSYRGNDVNLPVVA